MSEILKEDAQAQKALKRIISKVHKVVEERNTIIHGRWTAQMVVKSKAGIHPRGERYARKFDRRGAPAYQSPTEVMTVARKIAEAHLELYQFVSSSIEWTSVEPRRDLRQVRRARNAQGRAPNPLRQP